MVKVPLSNSFLERRDARRKFSKSPGAGASLAPQIRQRISLGSENDWKFRLRGCQSWKASILSLGVVVPTQINRYRVRSVGLGRDNLRSHFVFRPRHAPEWLRARFLPVVFLANEEELTRKIFTTSLNTTNPNTYVKFIFLRTSPVNILFPEQNRTKLRTGRGELGWVTQACPRSPVAWFVPPSGSASRSDFCATPSAHVDSMSSFHCKPTSSRTTCRRL